MLLINTHISTDKKLEHYGLILLEPWIINKVTNKTQIGAQLCDHMVVICLHKQT